MLNHSEAQKHRLLQRPDNGKALRNFIRCSLPLSALAAWGAEPSACAAEHSGF